MTEAEWEKFREALDRVVDDLVAKHRAIDVVPGDWTKLSVEAGEVVVTTISPLDIYLPAPNPPSKPERSQLLPS